MMKQIIFIYIFKTKEEKDFFVQKYKLYTIIKHLQIKFFKQVIGQNEYCELFFRTLSPRTKKRGRKTALNKLSRGKHWRRSRGKGND